jgi:hypothetical protein
MLYDSLDLPCLNRSYICTHSQFIKEFRPLYPEFDYSIPTEVKEKFIDSQKASNNCLIIFLSSSATVQEAAWLCHDNIETVYIFQDKLSRIVREANSRSYDFVADYIMDNSERMSGVVNLNSLGLVFKDLNEKIILNLNYNEIVPYAIALYLKEDIRWKGGILNKPEDARCLKIQRVNSVTDYFCIYYQRNDINLRIPLTIIQARFQAEMYANKINLRLQSRYLSTSLEKINKSNVEVEIDLNLLSPIKNQVRNDYFIVRHKLLCYLKMNKLTKEQFEINISKAKEKIVNSVCSGIEVCNKAIQMSLNKGLLPLNGYRERFAMDVQNPFNSLMPKTNLKVLIPQGGIIGKKLLQEVTEMIQSDMRTFSTDLIESGPGEIPNSVAIKKAFNTISTLRDKTKFYVFLEQLGQNCRFNVRNNSNNLKRKIAILSFAGSHDTFFEYLGRIRNHMLLNKK